MHSAHMSERDDQNQEGVRGDDIGMTASLVQVPKLLTLGTYEVRHSFIIDTRMQPLHGTTASRHVHSAKGKLYNGARPHPQLLLLSTNYFVYSQPSDRVIMQRTKVERRIRSTCSQCLYG